MENTVKLYSLSLSETRATLLALAFVLGNIALPQFCHLVPQGGHILLPIFFFTLIGAYKYGWQVGLATAILSPLANHVLFGMPAAAVLPVILEKSVFLALAAALIARRAKALTLAAVALTVVSYQLAGGLVEWAITGDIAAPLQDLSLGLPGLLLQIFGGYALLRYLLRN